MKKTRYTWSILIGIMIFHLLAATPAFAYLDPGTGSYILQILIAFVVGALFTIKPFFSKIKAVFARLIGKHGEDE